MISYLKGTILNKRKNFIILEVNGIGYQVFLNPTFFVELITGQPLEIYTHQHIKEDALDLYGFKNLEELEMFELLLSISGVGPRSALGILAVANPEELKISIGRGDSSLLTKVSGVGKKTAERIVLELRDKISHIEIVPSAGGGSVDVSGDEIDALISLGYSLQQAREAMRAVDPQISNSSERIREALKKMGR